MDGLVPEPFRLKLSEAVWLMKAASSDTSRPVLCCANVQTMKGSLWVATTDTHRLHLINLGPIDRELNFNIDLRRIIHEARFVKADSVLVEQDGSGITLGKKEGKKQQVWQIYAPWKLESVGEYPNIERVIPTEEVLGAPDSLTVNPKYFHDAIHPEAGGARIRAPKGPRKPIVLTDRRHSMNRWKAVIMPMAPGDEE